MERKDRKNTPKPAVDAPHEPHAAHGSAPMKTTWLILQGDTITEVESEKQPDLSVNPGQRMKVALGVAHDKATLEKLKTRWSKRARGIIPKEEVV